MRTRKTYVTFPYIAEENFKLVFNKQSHHFPIHLVYLLKKFGSTFVKVGLLRMPDSCIETCVKQYWNENSKVSAVLPSMKIAYSLCLPGAFLVCTGNAIYVFISSVSWAFLTFAVFPKRVFDTNRSFSSVLYSFWCILTAIVLVSLWVISYFIPSFVREFREFSFSNGAEMSWWMIFELCELERVILHSTKQLIQRSLI